MFKKEDIDFFGSSNPLNGQINPEFIKTLLEILNILILREMDIYIV